MQSHSVITLSNREWFFFISFGQPQYFCAAEVMKKTVFNNEHLLGSDMIAVS
jgi:hypothetical protein